MSSDGSRHTKSLKVIDNTRLSRPTVDELHPSTPRPIAAHVVNNKNQGAKLFRSLIFIIPKGYPIDSFCFSQPAGRNLCLRCPRPIAAKLVDRSICGLVPQIAPFSMRTLTRPARRDFYPRYVRPTSVRIKGATPCLHFARGVTN